MLGLDISTRQARDAARMAIQSAVAAVAFFAIMRNFGLPEIFVGVLSAVLIVQPSVGSTFGDGLNRLIATLIGSVFGAGCLILLPLPYSYSTAVALGMSMLFVNAVAAVRPEWRYGVVAAVAIALGAEENAIETAMDRGISIGIGVIVGFLTTLVVWPDTGAKRAQRHCRSALLAVADRLSRALENVRAESQEGAEESSSRYHSAIADAREAAKVARFAAADLTKDRIETIDKLYNSIIIVDRTAESSENSLTETDDFDDKVGQIRESVCEVVGQIADGESIDDDRLDRMDTVLSEARAIADDSDSDGDVRLLRQALVFGLGQITTSLRKLKKLYDDDTTASGCKT